MTEAAIPDFAGSGKTGTAGSLYGEPALAGTAEYVWEAFGL